ncbi:hypothetical protein AGMMS49574_14770 [Bacteroidia bacterium]|nr:hypothetical protein AGMMS49574_14770 [Bacteroidia bacterium]
MKTKNFFIVLMAGILIASTGMAQKKLTDPLKANLAQREVLKKDLKKKAIKQARKEAKTYKKGGYKTFIGGLPLDKQIEGAWIKSVELDGTGAPEYVVAQARVIGGNASAAKMQAMHQSKVELAGLISSNIAALIESSTANNELSQQEAASINNALQASKEFIAADLGRVFNEIEIYKELPNKNVEVLVCLSYNTRQALDIAQKSIKQKMEDKTDALHQKLDKLLKLDTFEKQTNTNLIIDED